MTPRSPCELAHIKSQAKPAIQLTVGMRLLAVSPGGLVSCKVLTKSAWLLPKSHLAGIIRTACTPRLPPASIKVLECDNLIRRLLVCPNPNEG